MNAVQLPHGFSAFDRRPQVLFNGTKLPLTPMAARILRRVIEAGAFVSNAELLGTNGGIPNTATLRVHIAAIRKALPEPFQLRNEAPGGYRFISPF